MLELLLAMFIMGALVTVAIPVFRTLIKGKDTERAATELSARIQYARSYAVSNHAYVALVFLRVGDNGKLEGITNVDVDPAYFNSAYRMAIVYKKGGAYTFQMWMPDSQWNFFPDGIIIPPGEENFGIQKSNDRSAADYWEIDTDADMSKVADVDLDELVEDEKIDVERCLIFKPDGQLVSGDKKQVLIRFAEVTYDPALVGQTGFKFIPKNRDEDGKVDHMILSLNPLTGKTQYHHQFDELQENE